MLSKWRLPCQVDNWSLSRPAIAADWRHEGQTMLTEYAQHVQVSRDYGPLPLAARNRCSSRIGNFLLAGGSHLQAVPRPKPRTKCRRSHARGCQCLQAKQMPELEVAERFALATL
eukprot:2881332-Amphidinium_carterae.1